MVWIILLIVSLFVLWMFYEQIYIKNSQENFSIYPYGNQYLNPYRNPYINPYSQCIQDYFGNIKCYKPMYYNKYYLPNYYRYPNRFRKIHNGYIY